MEPWYNNSKALLAFYKKKHGAYYMLLIAK